MSSLADMERALENLDRRLRGVEQLLPTLATKADLDRFATRADLESGLAQVRAFAEQVRDEVRVLAEGYVSVSDRVVSVSDRVASVSGRVVSVSDRLVSVSDRVDSVSDRVDSLSTDVKGIAYALDSLVARLEAKNVI
jgi:methyl-accepting chemotaxis protein